MFVARLAVLCFPVLRASEECSMLQKDFPSASHLMTQSEYVQLLEQGSGGSKAIPCVIHQTAKTHTLNAPGSHTLHVGMYRYEKETDWAQTWKDLNPECQYKLWNDTEINKLAETASPDLLWPIWEGLKPIQRADVFRYLVLYHEGGYYADVDVACRKPIREYEVPEGANMLAGYEFGHRFPEWQRKQIKFARSEQFQQWFIAAAPGHPILLRMMQLIRQRFTWKMENTLELTGPGVFSDAVHEFLAMKTPHAMEHEMKIRSHTPEQHFLSYPSENLYGSGDWKLWVFAAGRVNAAPQVAQDDPPEGLENLVEHHFEGSWKTDQDWEEKDLIKKRAEEAAKAAEQK